jgi:hypothetical protein
VNVRVDRPATERSRDDADLRVGHVGIVAVGASGMRRFKQRSITSNNSDVV